MKKEYVQVLHPSEHIPLLELHHSTKLTMTTKIEVSEESHAVVYLFLIQ